MLATLILIATTCIVSWIAFKNPKAGHDLVLWPPAVTKQKQYWRLVSYGFVHADMQHLLFNMITLFFFGRYIEQLISGYIGSAGYLLFYLGGLLVSILPSYLRNRDNANYMSLGASGAVSAVLFAFILIQPWTLIFVFFLPVPAILYAVLYVGYSIYQDHHGHDNINHSAHLWGAAYGVVFTLVMEPRVAAVFVDRLLHPGFL
jgi:membrane associated rhomboid family serine protease